MSGNVFSNFSAGRKWPTLLTFNGAALCHKLKKMLEDKRLVKLSQCCFLNRLDTHMCGSDMLHPSRCPLWLYMNAVWLIPSSCIQVVSAALMCLHVLHPVQSDGHWPFPDLRMFDYQQPGLSCLYVAEAERVETHRSCNV